MKKFLIVDNDPVEIKSISIPASHPRKTANQVAVDSLAESIKKVGLLQPIIVYCTSYKEYKLKKP